MPVNMRAGINIILWRTKLLVSFVKFSFFVRIELRASPLNNESSNKKMLLTTAV
jgi:hypothetical protein